MKEGPSTKIGSPKKLISFSTFMSSSRKREPRDRQNEPRAGILKTESSDPLNVQLMASSLFANKERKN